MATLHAPPKMSRVFAKVVVTEGAVTDVEEVEPFCCAAEALIGAAVATPMIEAMPPDMS